MRIQTRIFLVLSILVVAVVAVQVWLHHRQMRAVERTLGTVATSIGRDILTREADLIRPLIMKPPPVVKDRPDEEGAEPTRRYDVVVEVEDEPDVDVHKVWWRQKGGEKTEVPADGEAVKEMPTEPPAEGSSVHTEFKVITRTAVVHRDSGENSPDDGPPEPFERVIRLEVDDEKPHMMMLFEGDEVAEFEIPTTATREVFRHTLRTSLVAAAVVLILGLAVSAVVARRLASPLRNLVAKAEELGSGGFGMRVPVTASGEIGELESAFDRMSVRLGELEREREAWRRREHLAQLGDLSRGLAHTVRNPLHTLGLAVEELAGEGEDPRVATARSEIRRIDRWIRSFLAIGAGDAASFQRCDLTETVQEAMLETGGSRVAVSLEAPDRTIEVEVVPTGFRAALCNLLENAVQASEEGGAVSVVVTRAADRARIEIRDRGAGIPEAVREKLFEPHQTTRPGGAGMGLFLARQLIEEMNRGTLSLEDRDGGGTLAVVEIPVAEAV